MLGTDDRYKKEYTAPRGGKYSIETDQRGFYFIHQSSGGVRPAVCDRKFTSRVLAEAALQKYFDEKPEITPRGSKKEE